MRIVRRPLEILRRNLPTYLRLNAIVYGALAIGLLAGGLFPSVASAGLEVMGSFASTSPLSESAGSAMGGGGTILGFAGLILFSTVVFGALGMATLPSLVIPFSGVVIHAAFALLLGLSYAPQDGAGWTILGAHIPTLIIELQGYILVLLGAVLLGRYVLSPRKYGLKTRRAGYRRGLVESAWLYIPALVVLVIGALYEAVEVLVILA